MTFGLLCVQLLNSVVFLLYMDIDLTKQLATRNALIIWVSIIPTHFLALLFLFIFYKHCHVWKKEGVVVGFAYDESPAVCDSISQKKFKCSWLTHSSLESRSNEAFEKDDLDSPDHGDEVGMRLLKSG